MSLPDLGTGAAGPAAPVHPVLPGATGAGKRLLLVPGLGQSAAHWGPFARWLASRDRALLAVDPGALAAQSAAPRGSYDRLREMAEALAAACDEHGISGVLGHSAGAPAALLTASLADFGTVTLIEPVPSHFAVHPAPRGPGTPGPDVPGTSGPDVPGTPGLVARPGDDPGESLRRLHPLAAETTLRAVTAALAAVGPSPPPAPPLPESARPLLRDRADRTGAALAAHLGRVVVLRGAHSALLRRTDAETLAARAAHGELRVVERAGHSPHIDAPRAAVAAFLGERP
ncbi:alpha/beta fold hydrolase [Streptomyces sp. NPDC017546]|uniref:alpha/beta fold hydrolase n=1 Tax=unclassified Streptomyces TaxID=2593676 RepID=UPI002363115A|nr:alpha/beta fold hydrolase [Streptomyces sp. MMBL 11-1]